MKLVTYLKYPLSIITTIRNSFQICSDKLSRLEHIINSKTNAVGETAEQEWIDIAGYAMQAIRLIKANRI